MYVGNQIISIKECGLNVSEGLLNRADEIIR
jgi:hypothetical protein